MELGVWLKVELGVLVGEGVELGEALDVELGVGVEEALEVKLGG